MTIARQETKTPRDRSATTSERGSRANNHRDVSSIRSRARLKIEALGFCNRESVASRCVATGRPAGRRWPPTRARDVALIVSHGTLVTRGSFDPGSRFDLDSHPVTSRGGGGLDLELGSRRVEKKFRKARSGRNAHLG